MQRAEELAAERAALGAVEDEEAVREYFLVDRQVDRCERDIRDEKMLEENCIPFLQPGRLIRVRTFSPPSSSAGADKKGKQKGGAGGGGGSSYIGHSDVSSGSTTAGTNQTSGGSSATNYSSGIGNAGTNTAGGNGRLVIIY